MESLAQNELMASGGRLNIKMLSYQYRDPDVKAKTVSRPSYLEHGNPHTWERLSLYWDGAQAIRHISHEEKGDLSVWL